MAFKKIENSINFCLLCLIIFFGISQLFLISNFMSLPVKGRDNFTSNYVSDTQHLIVNKGKVTDFWRLDLGGDHKISNIENIIIWILMLWGFLRVIDLERILEKYKKDI